MVLVRLGQHRESFTLTNFPETLPDETRQAGIVSFSLTLTGTVIWDGRLGQCAPAIKIIIQQNKHFSANQDVKKGDAMWRIGL